MKVIISEKLYKDNAENYFNQAGQRLEDYEVIKLEEKEIARLRDELKDSRRCAMCKIRREQKQKEICENGQR